MTDSTNKKHHNSTDWAWNPSPAVQKAVNRGRRKYAQYKKEQLQKPLEEISQEIYAMRNQEIQPNATTKKSTPTRPSSPSKKTTAKKKVARSTATRKKTLSKKSAPAKKVSSRQTTAKSSTSTLIPLKKIIPDSMTPQEARRRLRKSVYADLRVDGHWKFTEADSKKVIAFLTGESN